MLPVVCGALLGALTAGVIRYFYPRVPRKPEPPLSLVFKRRGKVYLQRGGNFGCDHANSLHNPLDPWDMRFTCLTCMADYLVSDEKPIVQDTVVSLELAATQ